MLRSRDIRRALLKQAVVLPLLAMLIPIIWALFLPGYSSIGQHISEVALLQHPIAIVQRTAAFLTGLSILIFAVAVGTSANNRMPFTSISATAAGASMASNGVFVMGTPLHGLYGLGLFLALVPACYAAEIREANRMPLVVQISLTVAVLSLAYLWLLFSGLDPPDLRGLTQRAATVTIFGWYSLASYALLRLDCLRAG